MGDWTWLAVYELENEAVLKSEEYKRAREADGDDESRMFGFLSRRVYTLVEDGKSEDYGQSLRGGKSRIMSINGLHASAGSEGEILEQYDGTVARSGWLRTSSWRLSTAADPRTWEEQTNVPEVLVLQEWEDTSAVRARLDAAADASDLTQEKASLRLWKQF